MRASSLLRSKEFIARGIVHHACNPSCLLPATVLQRHGHAEHRISVGKIRRAIERIDIPAVVAALIVQPLLFAQHVMRRKLLA